MLCRFKLLYDICPLESYISGRFLGEATRLWDLARRDPTRLGMAPALVDRTDLAWAFQPSSPTLREAANRVLEEWTRDGTLAEFLQPWLPATR